MKKILLQLFVLAIVLHLQSCSPCDEPIQVTDGYLKLDLVDSATGDALFSLVRPLVNKDLVVVRSLQGDTVRHYFALINGAGSDREALHINFLAISDTAYRSSFTETQCKDLLVSLSSTRRIQLKVCFKSRQSPCGDSFATIFNFLDISYIGEKIASESRTVYITAVVRI